VQAFVQGLAADPYDPNAAREAARSAEEAGDLERARELHGRALALDPRGPTTVLAAAEFELRHEGAARAVALLQDLLEVLPDRADFWASLGEAETALGRTDAARKAYERALQLQPDEPTATAGLAQLDPPEGTS
jgi:cytochrome c-type biogenesis protein CcmH/NrfG